MSDVVRRCTLGGPYCDALSERIAGQISTPRGIVSCEALNLQTSTIKHHGLAYKRGAKDSPLFFNFCPWCGVQIYAPRGSEPAPAPVGPGVRTMKDTFAGVPEHQCADPVTCVLCAEGYG